MANFAQKDNSLSLSIHDLEGCHKNKTLQSERFRLESYCEQQTSQPKDTLLKRKRRFATLVPQRTTAESFWEITDSNNYTVSLNNSPVLCNAFFPPVDSFFSLFKNSLFFWRTKKLSQRTAPTMVPKNDANSLSLLTTTIRSLSRLNTTSITFFDWKPHDLNLSQKGPSQESLDLVVSDEEMAKVELIGREPDTEPVLDENVAEQIRQQLPRISRLAPTWNLLYSLDQDGSSMATLYRKVKDKGPLILAIKDEGDQVFGAFVTDPFKPRTSFYGTGECFLWKCIYVDKETPTVRFYLWSGKNEYLIFSSIDYLAIGGGDGRTGLWIDSGLERGTSAACETFDNEVLSSTPQFDCLGLEIWGFKN
ncbi:5012_t:CDS:2 [Paraglomus brasilianum]|uniref:Oxidation resistance protein 1 n=1 Tax=Paraglomus brasilianum TaxID=144538 RepID=A0A9N8WK42_9GLOM|nr:5012_t:CDS:2 [Paraglomus brasilianum]